jgi:hypothetical protein
MSGDYVTVCEAIEEAHVEWLHEVVWERAERDVRAHDFDALEPGHGVVSHPPSHEIRCRWSFEWRSSGVRPVPLTGSGVKGRCVRSPAAEATRPLLREGERLPS